MTESVYTAYHLRTVSASIMTDPVQLQTVYY